jgi:superfamily II DNA or RNA helicase
MELRPYQKACLGKLKALVDRGTTRVLVKHATGLGKTPILASIPAFFGFKGRILVIVHRETLAAQAVQTLRQWNPGITVGLEMADNKAGHAKIVVASIQTIGRSGSPRLEKFYRHQFDALLIDEAHHSTAKSYQSVLKHFGVDIPRSRILLVGFTATPNRADGTGLDKVFDSIADDLSILWGIQHGWLVDLPAIRANTSVRLDAVKITAGDFALDELERAVNIEARNLLIVNTWLARASDRRTLVFTVDIQHGKDVAEAFRIYGASAEAIWGNDPDKQNKLDAHRSGKIQVLCNCNLLTEGYDDRNIRCIIMARPTKSETLYAQMVGRGSRLPEGLDNLLDATEPEAKIEKLDCLIIDVADVTRDNSLVTLGSLFGLGTAMDLDGKSPTKAVQRLKQANAKNPSADLTRLKHVDDIEKYIEIVDILEDGRTPEIIHIDGHQWHRARDKSSYVLLLIRNEAVCIFKDRTDLWHAKGTVNSTFFDKTYLTFDSALREADKIVRALNGIEIKYPPKRVKWRDQQPSQSQINFCRRLGLTISTGATQGDVHELLGAWVLRRKEKKARVTLD